MEKYVSLLDSNSKQQDKLISDYKKAYMNVISFLKNIESSLNGRGLKELKSIYSNMDNETRKKVDKVDKTLYNLIDMIEQKSKDSSLF